MRHAGHTYFKASRVGLSGRLAGRVTDKAKREAYLLFGATRMSSPTNDARLKSPSFSHYLYQASNSYLHT